MRNGGKYYQGILFCILLSVFIVPITGSLIPGEPESTGIFTGIVESGTDIADISAIAAWKENLSDTDRKISSDLLMLISSPENLPAGMDTGSLKLSLKEDGVLGYSSGEEGVSTGSVENVYVYINLFPGNATTIADPLVTSVAARDEENHIMAAWVPLSNITAISRLPEVRLITPVYPAVTNTGSVTSEGDAIHMADQTRVLPGGINGTGITVGVISDGVDSRNSSIATGDLPADFRVLSNDQGGDEGTAMGEIVYDLAPGSDLIFADMASDQISFARHMKDLSEAGCQVIVDDIYYPDEPAFEDGIIAQAADILYYRNNTLMVSSAGNYAQRHFIGNFSPFNGTDWMDFSSVGNASYAPTPEYPYLYVNILPAYQTRIALQWNDKWGYSENDYDLYLYNWGGDLLASSVDFQDGSGNPFECIRYTNTGSSAIVGVIKVRLYDGVNRTIAVDTFGAPTYTNNRVNTSSSWGHSCSAGTLGAAAIPYDAITTIESFSSHGPRPIFFPFQEVRQKPDISGIDGVKITGAGDFGSYDGTNWRFYGTSAAAPHIAGLGALLWSANPSLTAAEVRSLLTSSAVDLGEPGYDPVFGHGRADVLAAYRQLTAAPPVVTGIVPDQGTAGSSVPFTISGTNLKSQAVINLTRDGSGKITTIGTVSGPDLVGTFALPPGAATGAWNVSVNEGGGMSNDNILFTVRSPNLTADFTAEPRGGTAPLLVNFTDLSTGSPATWAWTFGDGGISSLQHPSHLYTSPGLFTVNLTVTNSQGSDTKVAERYIYVGYSFTRTITATAGPGGIIVPNGSVRVLIGQDQTFAITPDDGYTISSVLVDGTGVGPVSSYTFNQVSEDHTISAAFTRGYTLASSTDAFGYIIPEGVVTKPEGSDQTYDIRSLPGAEIARLTDNDTPVPVPAGSAAFTYPISNIVDNHTVTATNDAKEGVILAAFTVNKTSGPAPLTVLFNDTSAGGPDQWYWTFGDGSSSTDRNMTHTYQVPGVYDVSLWIRSSQATGSIEKPGLITAS